MHLSTRPDHIKITKAKLRNTAIDLTEIELLKHLKHDVEDAVAMESPRRDVFELVLAARAGHESTSGYNSTVWIFLGSPFLVEENKNCQYLLTLNANLNRYQ